MVFDRIWNFLKRHRRKFVYTGLFVAGGYSLLKYLKWKLNEYQEKQMTEAFALARRQQHFESNQRTCNATVLSLVASLREILMKELDCERLRDQLEIKPSNKVSIWNDLKLLAFTRMIVSIYSTSILVVMLRVQLNIIGGCIYARNKAERPLSESEMETQHKYLESIQHFMENGVVELMDAVRHSVDRELLSFSLKQSMNMASLRELIKSIRMAIEGNSADDSKTSPFAKYILTSPPFEQTVQDASILHISTLYTETVDIVNSPDFNTVLTSTIECGFELVFNHISGVFTTPVATPSNSSRPRDAVALARVIPPVSGAVHFICSETANDYMQGMLTLECVNEYGQHIYEAFCEPRIDQSNETNS